MITETLTAIAAAVDKAKQIKSDSVIVRSAIVNLQHAGELIKQYEPEIIAAAEASGRVLTPAKTTPEPTKPAAK